MPTRLPQSLTRQLDSADPTIVSLLDQMRWGENPWDEMRILQLLDCFTASPHWDAVGAPENPGNDIPVALTPEQVRSEIAALMACRARAPVDSSDVLHLTPEELDRLFDDEPDDPPS